MPPRLIPWAVVICLPFAGISCAQSGQGLGSGGEAALLSGPYVIAVSTSRATVCWQTTSSVAGSVRYGIGEDTNTARIAGPVANFHAVALAGLAPGKRYRAAVYGGPAELGGLTFRTLPAEADRFTFYVYGDTRDNPSAHARVAEGIFAEARRLDQLTFVVHSGDFAGRGSDASRWADQFFNPASVFLSVMPLVPVRGNHEPGSDLFEKCFPIYPRSVAAGPAYDYFMDYGSVRIVVFDQYVRKNMDARLTWLGGALAAAGKRWRFVTFHEPLYSSGYHGPNLAFRRLLEPVLRKGRVHAVFCGHDHNYERITPQGGVTYFTSGGGGAPLRGERRIEKQPAWSARFEMAYHFLIVAVEPERTTIQALRLTAKEPPFEVFDQVEIPWECGWPKGP